jgi:hypothetical protein
MGILTSLSVIVADLTELKVVLAAIAALPAGSLPANVAADVAAVETKLASALAVLGVLGL